MDIRNLIDTLSAALRRRRAAASPIPVRPIRASLSDVPQPSRSRPAYRPAPPPRPASNM